MSVLTLISQDVEAALAIDGDPRAMMEVIAMRLHCEGLGVVDPADWTYRHGEIGTRAQMDDIRARVQRADGSG